MMLLLIILIVAFIISLIIGFLFFANSVDMKVISKKGNKTLRNNAQHYDLVPYTPGIYCQGMRDWSDKAANKQDLYIQNKDKMNLHALYFPIENSHKYVVALHGYNSQAKNNGSFFDKFNQMGLNVLAPDARAHGLSEGRYSAMGYLECKDIVEWINLIISKDKEASIFLYGVSMGAATVMYTVGEDLPENVKFAVEDCGFCGSYLMFKEILKSVFHLPSFPVLQLVSVISKIVLGFTLKEADCRKALAKAKIPMIFIHGTKDKFVPYYMLDLNYNACSSPKEKMTFESSHARSSTVDPVRYYTKIQEYIDKYM